MSKYSTELGGKYPDVKSLKEATRKSIKKGSKIALEEFHDARSLERLKKEIKRIK